MREAVEFSSNEDADTSSPKKVSALPAWLVSSFASVEKFKITAAKTRESIQHLQKTCKRFDELKRRSDEYFAERERLMRSRKRKAYCAVLELLLTKTVKYCFISLGRYTDCRCDIENSPDCLEIEDETVTALSSK